MAPNPTVELISLHSVSARLEGLMDLYSQGYERSYTVNSSILNAIEPHLKDFQQLLLDPPKVKDRRSGGAQRKMQKSCLLSLFVLTRFQYFPFFCCRKVQY